MSTLYDIPVRLAGGQSATFNDWAGHVLVLCFTTTADGTTSAVDNLTYVSNTLAARGLFPFLIPLNASAVSHTPAPFPILEPLAPDHALLTWLDAHNHAITGPTVVLIDDRGELVGSYPGIDADDPDLLDTVEELLPL